MTKLRQYHRAQKRNPKREEAGAIGLPDDSIYQLADRLVDPGTSPSRNLMREELRDRVRAALAQLEEHDQYLLVMRYVEQLSMKEIAAVLKITEGAAKVRHFRALERIRPLLEDLAEDQP